jgi:hypothetical protein
MSMAGVAKAATAFNRARATARNRRASFRAKMNVTSRSSDGLEHARRTAMAYEYLCHLEETRRWMETCLHVSS